MREVTVNDLIAEVSILCAKIFDNNGVENIKEFEKRYELDFSYLVRHIIFEIYYLNYLESENKKSLRSYIVEEDGNLERYRGIVKFYERYRTIKDNEAIQNNNGGTLYEKHNIRYKKLSNIAEKIDGQSLTRVDYNQLMRIYKYPLFVQIFSSRLFDNKKVNNKQFIEYILDLDKLYDEFDSIQCNFEKCIEYYQLELSCLLERLFSIANRLKEENNKDVVEKIGVLFNYYGDIIDPDLKIKTRYKGRNRFILANDKYLEAMLMNKKKLADIQNEIVFMNAVRNKIIEYFIVKIRKKEIILIEEYNHEFWELYSKKTLYREKNFIKKDGKVDNELLRIIRLIRKS